MDSKTRLIRSSERKQNGFRRQYRLGFWGAGQGVPTSNHFSRDVEVLRITEVVRLSDDTSLGSLVSGSIFQGQPEVGDDE
jgi:hypothetical protein